MLLHVAFQFSQYHFLKRLSFFHCMLLPPLSQIRFSENCSFVILGRFIPRYFILFDVMINAIVSLISLFDLSVFVYRNAVDLCVLILCPANLPNSLMSSNSFLECIQDFLGTVSCHLPTVSALFLLFKVEFLLFLFLL